MRRGLCRISITSLLGALLIALPSTLRAQTSGSAVYGGSPREVSLSVNVTASVSASCSFMVGAMPKGDYSVGNLEGPYLIDIPFSLTCNSPSRVGIVSNNGGMKAHGVSSAPPGYAHQAPYRVTLHLAGDSGNSAHATCESPTLTSGASGCAFRGPATGTAGLRLPGPSQGVPGSYIRINQTGEPQPETLIAADYSDRLTVTISPAT
ncbi:MAG TPA: hypothetical protein VEW04_03930 [Allosphingosinicella sp.]|nr:hypothetical protein [Allosphingosinicella sp.]